MGQLYLVRHGQASFGADDYDVLSERGAAQSRRLGEWLAERGVVADAVLHGGLSRQRDTARHLAGSAGWDAPLEADPDWDELDFLTVVGTLPGVSTEGLDNRGFHRVFQEATARWTSGSHDGDYEETWGQFRTRVEGAFARACERAAGSGATVVAVSSGGVVAALVARLLLAGAGAGGEVAPSAMAAAWDRANTVTVNTSYTRVAVGSGGPRLLTFNEHPHLDGDLLTYR